MADIGTEEWYKPVWTGIVHSASCVSSLAEIRARWREGAIAGPS